MRWRPSSDAPEPKTVDGVTYYPALHIDQKSGHRLLIGVDNRGRVHRTVDAPTPWSDIATD